MNLKNLLLVFQKALLEAQAVSRDQHQGQLARYLDDEDRPLTMTIRLPGSEAEDVAGGGRGSELIVPLLSLVPNSSLQIKDAEIEVDVGLRTLFPDGQVETDTGAIDLSNLEVRAVGMLEGGGARAKLRVRFEAARLSEEDLPAVELEMVEATIAE